MKTKILAFCDSPSLTSGFARVIEELASRWHTHNVEIDIRGIGFTGWGYDRFPHVKLLPGGIGGEWQSQDKLLAFLQRLNGGGYTHVWLMQDTFNLVNFHFPKALRDICARNKIKSMMYFPIDAS